MKKVLKHLSLFTMILLLASSCNFINNLLGKNKDDEVKQDAPGEISFTAKAPDYLAEASFKRWKFVEFDMDKALETMTALVEIDLSSVVEKNDQLTAHLKDWDYFDVEHNPTALVEIFDVRPTGIEDRYKAKLILKTKKAEQELKTEFEVKSRRPYKIKGWTRVNRSVFKIGIGNDKVAKDIRIEYETKLPSPEKKKGEEDEEDEGGSSEDPNGWGN